MKLLRTRARDRIKSLVAETPRKKQRVGTTWEKMEFAQGAVAVMMDRHKKYAESLEIDYRDLITANRRMPIADIRACAMYVLWDNGYTLHECAQAFGRVNHTTALQATRKIKDHIKIRGLNNYMGKYIEEARKVYEV